MTMEHLFTILLGICTLSAGLQANPISDFKPEMIGTPKCKQDSKFYTPRTATPDMTRSCVYRCFEAGLDTIKAECNITMGQRLHIDQIKSFLNKAQDGTTNPKDCDCKKWPQRSVKEFLLQMKVVVEEMSQIKKSKL